MERGGGTFGDAVFGVQVNGPITGGGGLIEGGARGTYKRKFKINISIS